MNYIYRNRCLITGKDDLEHLYTLKNLPIFIGCTDQPQTEDIKEDLEIYISKSSGIIQLKKLMPPNIVYSGYHSEAVGAVWEEHFNEFSKFILKYNQSENIIEIGGSNGRLAEKCLILDNQLNWTIIEPNPEKKIFKNDKIRVIQSFIENFEIDHKNSTFVHSHTLEHLYDPISFFKSISKKSEIGDIMLFSIPNLYEYLNKKFVNTINFEHTYFLTEDVADFILKKYGYELIDKYYYKDHSIFYSIRFLGEDRLDKKNELKFDKYLEYKNMYLEFINFIDSEVSRINLSIDQFISQNKDSKIYLFGAHIFSQFLINKGLKTSNISSIIDNSPNKIGKRLYGTSLHVVKPEIVKDTSSLIILKAGQYQVEVENQLKRISSDLKYVL